MLDVLGLEMQSRLTAFMKYLHTPYDYGHTDHYPTANMVSAGGQTDKRYQVHLIYVVDDNKNEIVCSIFNP